MRIHYSANNFGFRRLFVPVLLLAAATAQDAETALPNGEKWRVRLLAPLSTNFNRKGDMVSARVLEPASFQGAILEGVIRELKAGGGSAKVSSVQFDFVTLHAKDKAFHVSASLVEALNSRREPGVDEEGAALESTGAGITGKLIGVFARGASSTLRLTTRFPQLVFAPGSEFVVQLQPRKAANER